MRRLILICLAIGYFGQWPPAVATASLHIAGMLSDATQLPVAIQQSAPNDPLLGSQGYLSTIGIPQAWSVTTGSNLTIAVIDTGIDLQHEDLVGKLWINADEIPSNGLDDDHNGYIDDYNGYNFLNNNADISDVHGHGTGIASIIAASTNNGKGIAGITWAASVMVVKALNSVGGGDFETIARAIRYAADNGARVINMSFGSVDSYPALADAVSYALNRQVIIVAAVGNNHGYGIFYPAAYDGVIAVSAINAANQVSSFSNYGPGVDLAAPGENILMAGLSANGVSSYVRGSGSSFATAEVTGTVALLLARYPTLTSVQLNFILKATATPLSQDPNDIYFGAGRVNAWQAINYQPRTLYGQLASSRSTAPADGITPAYFELTVTDEFGQPQAGVPVTARVTGANNIINSALASGDTNIGATDSSGKISFNLASNVAETKSLGFVSGANVINAPSASITFRADRSFRQSMSWISQSPYPTLSLGDTAQLWLTVKNTGNVSWVSAKQTVSPKGQLRLGTDRPQDRGSSFYDSASWPSSSRVAVMTPSIVRPGETARFDFTLRGNYAGNFREYFRPVVEYVTWLSDLGIYWDVKVLNPNLPASSLLNIFTDTTPQDYSADIRGKTNNITLSPGQVVGFWVDLINTGSAAWMSLGKDLQGTGSVRLGTATPHDRVSAVYSPTWLSGNRVSSVSATVSPNAHVELYFEIKAPLQPGIYQENFQLVAEYVTWFGPTFGWTVTVK